MDWCVLKCKTALHRANSEQRVKGNMSSSQKIKITPITEKESHRMPYDREIGKQN